jgi:hypothetical protein
MRRFVATALLLTINATGIGQVISTPTPTRTPTPINIGNFVWDDLDGDGRQDGGEAGLPGVVVQLWNAAKNDLIDSAVTNASGNYTVTAPAAGNYRIRVLLPALLDQFSPKDDAGAGDLADSDINSSGPDFGFTDSFNIASNVISITTKDAGIIKYRTPTPTRTPTPINVGNFVWNDTDGDGIQDGGEVGLANINVQLWNAAKTNLIDIATTNANGNYTLIAPAPGDYRVRVVLPPGASFTLKDAAADTQDSDFNPSGVNLGFTDVYSFASNLISITSIDAGLTDVPSTPTNTRTPTRTATRTPTRTFTRTATRTPTPVPPSEFLPAALQADPSAGATSDGNDVFEPGESTLVRPAWKNNTGGSLDLSGVAAGLTGPGIPGYVISDTAAAYGTVAPGSTAGCGSTGNCYAMFVGSPAMRPASHWDASFTETVDEPSTPKNWSLHLGDSFTDVPRSHLFYRKIETIFHHLITVGCTPTEYCPAQKVPRSQMAIFVARGIAGGGANIPAAGLWNGQPYNCISGGTSLFSDVLPADIFCKAVHYIAVQNVSSGCGPSLYCGDQNVTREEMAIFTARAIVAPAGGPGVPETYGPDPGTGLSYSCNVGSPSLHFTDIPASDPLCKHAHFLWARGVISGCSATQYCASGEVGRDEMAKFLANAFKLVLYGP